MNVWIGMNVWIWGERPYMSECLDRCEQLDRDECLDM